MHSASLASSKPPSHMVAARLLIFALICGMLYWGRVILVPLALAVLLSFVLYPLVRAFQRLHMPRLVAVISAMTLVTALLFALGWLVTAQIGELARNLPVYRENIVLKVKEVRGFMRGGTIDEIKETIEEVDEQVSREEASESQAADPTASPVMVPPERQDEPVSVKIVPENNLLGIDFSKTFSPVVDPLATGGLAFILTIFFLIKREDLRDRMVSFAGPSQLLPTVRALNEAGNRISRYLVTQFLINAGHGLAVGIALYFLQIPYAVVWGLCAAVFRYVPYVGPWAAAALPIAVSMITAPGWTAPLSVIGVFLTLELISNNVIEPMFYGRSVGLSEIAVLISAVVWAWLWGPVGLVLATPLSVCLVVLGQHVPDLSFFSRLMVDETEVDPRTQLYHRLVSGDEENALLHVSAYLKDHSWREAVDDLLMPTLAAAKRDLANGNLQENEAKFISEVVNDLIEQHCDVLPDGHGASTHTIITCPPQGILDSAALELAEHTLEDHHRQCDIINLNTSLLSAEVADRIAQTNPVAVVVASLPPEDLTYARRWCRLVRRRCPDVYIIGARWHTEETDMSAAKAVLTEAGANIVVGSTASLWNSIAPRLNLRRATEETEGDATNSAPATPIQV